MPGGRRECPLRLAMTPMTAAIARPAITSVNTRLPPALGCHWPELRVDASSQTKPMPAIQSMSTAQKQIVAARGGAGRQFGRGGRAGGGSGDRLNIMFALMRA